MFLEVLELTPIAVVLAGFASGYGAMVVGGTRFTTRNVLLVGGITSLVVGMLVGDDSSHSGWMTMLGVLCIGGAAVMAYRATTEGGAGGG